MSTLETVRPPLASDPPPVRRDRWWWGVGAITLLALGLRLLLLGSEPLWVDEAFSYSFALGVDATIDDPSHPPGYYALLLLWNSLVGTELWWGRFLSVLLGTAAVPFVALSGRMIAGPVAGLLAGLFLALSPYQIQHAQDVRMYAALTLCAAVLIWAVMHALTTPRLGKGVLVLYALTTSFTLWLHGGGLLVVGAINLVALGYFVAERSRAGRFSANAKAWLVATAVAGATWLPWVPVFVGRLLNSEQVLEAPWYGFGQLWRSQWYLASGYVPIDTPIAFVLTLFWVALGVSGLWVLRRTPIGAALAVLWLLVPTMLVVLTLTLTPLFSTHAVLWTSIPFYLAAASALAALRQGLKTYHDTSNLDGFVLLVVVSLLAMGVLGYHLEGGSYEKVGTPQADRNYVQVVDELAAAELSQDDVVLINPGFLVHQLRYHWREQYPTTPMPEMIGLPYLEPAEATTLAAAGRDEVWLIYGYPYYPTSDPDNQARDALQALGGDPDQVIDDERFAEVYRYSMPAEVRDADRREVESDEL